MATPGMITLPRSVIEEAIESLDRAGCQFFACQGPDEPVEDMVTCHVCATMRELRILLAQSIRETEETTMTAKTDFATTIVYSTDSYHVIQRPHLDGEGNQTWVDSSSNYYGEEGQVAALAQRDQMREIFGEDQVRVVRRDVKVTQTPVE